MMGFQGWEGQMCGESSQIRWQSERVGSSAVEEALPCIDSPFAAVPLLSFSLSFSEV